MDIDDSDRVLGLTTHDAAVAPALAHVDGDGGDGEREEYLDLGPWSDNGDETGGGGDSGSEADQGDVGDTGVVPLSDETLMNIGSKKDAKALGKELYKRWKKLQKRKSKEDSHHRDSKRKKKDKQDHKDRKSKKRGREKRRRKGSDNDSDDDYDDGRENRKDSDVDDDMNDYDRKREVVGKKKKQKRSRREKPIAFGDEELGAAPFADFDDVLRVEEAAAKHVSKRVVKESSTGPKAKKLTREAQRGVFRSIASGVVNMMREARLKDEVDMNERRPPLHRVCVRENVVAQCRREALWPYLIEEGVLQELSTWLYDFTRNELAAFELRSDALDVLLSFPIDGELDTGVARNGDDILDAFTGITREHLIHTDLGSAVNAVRQAKREVHQNRAKAVRLLERLSRAMSGGVQTSRRRGGGGCAPHASDDLPSAVTWKCKDDPTVMPPFHAVRTGTEVFQSALARPDPLDPLSYLRVPPRRAPKAYVTNLGGNVTAGE